MMNNFLATSLQANLTVENISISYSDMNVDKSNHHEIINISRVINDYFLNPFSKNQDCLPLNESTSIEFNLTFSPPTRISAVHLNYRFSNQKPQNIEDLPFIKPFISSYRNCVKTYFSDPKYHYPGGNERIDYVCDVIEREKVLKEKINKTKIRSNKLSSVGLLIT